MSELRKIINDFITKSGVFTFQIISGLTDWEIAQIFNPQSKLSTEILEKINEAMKSITNMTSMSHHGNNYMSKIKVKPNDTLIADVRQILEETRLSTYEFAFRVSMSHNKLKSWLHGAENKFGWADIELKILREVESLRRNIQRSRRTIKAPQSLNASTSDMSTGDIDVRNFVTGFLMARAPSSPMRVVNCDITH